VTMCWVQIISRKGQWETRTHKVRGRARFQSCRNGGKSRGLLAPEVGLPDPAGILRDYMPDSNFKIGKDRVRTAWRHAESGRNVHSAWFGESPSAAKAVERVSPNGTIKIVPFPKSIDSRRHEVAPIQNQNQRLVRWL
jgi:hypothetical protein